MQFWVDQMPKKYPMKEIFLGVSPSKWILGLENVSLKIESNPKMECDGT